MTAVSTYEVRRAGPRFGAEIFGIDFARDIDDATAERLRQDFLTHKVLVFRDQNLTPEQHVAAARIFGEPFDYPTAVRDETNRFGYPYNVEKTGKASTWHRRPVPQARVQHRIAYVPACFRARRTHAVGGSASGVRRPIRAGQTATEVGDAVYDVNAGNYAQGSQKTAVRETVEHPVVLAQPDTGRRGLFISSSALGLTGVTPGARSFWPICSRTRHRRTTQSVRLAAR
jgi:taurine dioxygenase